MESKTLAALQPKEKQYEVKISKGLFLICYPTGKKTFFVRWKDNGKNVKKKLGDFPVLSLASAMERASEGREKKSVASYQTLGDIVDLYMNEHIALKSRGRTHYTYANILKNHFGSMRDLPADIHPKELRTYIVQIKDPTPQAKMLTIIRAACKYSFIPDCTSGIKKPQSRQVERFLTKEEKKRLLDFIDSDPHMLMSVRRIIKFLMLSGFRNDEGQSLRWEWIDFKNNLICFPEGTTKTGKSNRPISPACKNFLFSFRQKEGLVFASRGGKKLKSLNRTWDRIRNAIGLQGFRIHDLRHSFVSDLVRNGVDLYKAGKAVGHASTRTTQRYAHLTMADIHAALDAYAPKLS